MSNHGRGPRAPAPILNLATGDRTMPITFAVLRQNGQPFDRAPLA